MSFVVSCFVWKTQGLSASKLELIACPSLQAGPFFSCGRCKTIRFLDVFGAYPVFGFLGFSTGFLGFSRKF